MLQGIKAKLLVSAFNLGLFTYPKIIDISYCQPHTVIDWAKLKELGVAVIIRMGQGVWEDAEFREHCANAVKYGVLWGVYWFYQPDMPAAPQVQAFMKIYASLAVKPKVIQLDVEDIHYFEDNPDGTRTEIWIKPPSAQVHSTWLLTWLQEIEKATGVIPGVYTRADYWTQWTVRSKDWAHFYLWIASWTLYSSDIRMPPDWSKWTVWQYAGGTNRQEGVEGPVDGNHFNGTQTDMIKFFGGEQPPQETTMAGIYKTDVPMSQRAWVVEIRGDEKPLNGYKSMGADAIILPMVTMSYWDGSHQRVIPEPTFVGRFSEVQAAGLPVFGKILVDAAIVSVEQHTKPELEGHNVWQNLVVPRILDAWHIGPWSQGSLKPEDFRPIKALIFEQTNDVGWQGKMIEDFWQAFIHRYVIDKLRVLMAAGAVPTVPIILKTTPEFLAQYQADYSILLQGGDRPTWLYLALSEPKLTSTNVYSDLWGIYQFAPGDDFKFSYLPDNYGDRVLLYEFSAGKQKLSFLGGNNLAYLSKWCDDAAGLTEFIGAPPIVVPPTEPPPATPPSVEDRLTALEKWAGMFPGSFAKGG